MPLSSKPITIEITYSNSETKKLGVKEGDQFQAFREYYLRNKSVIIDGALQYKPVRVLKQQCWFEVNGVQCVAYKCQHDEDVMIPVTTCKIVKSE